GDGPAAAAMEAMRSNYTAVVVFAAGRGRMDVVDGSSGNQFAKGDYILFDSSDYIVVEPQSKQFYGTPKDLMTQLSSAQQAAGMSMSIKNLTVSLDTLGPGDPIGGLATQHYRINEAYTMVIDASGMGIDLGSMAPPPMDTKSTIELWYADIPNFPPNPFAGFGASLRGQGSGALGGMSGMMKALSDTLAAMEAALPRGRTAVKMTTSMRLSGMMAMGTDMSTEISDIKSTDVDADQLVLPDGFTQTAMPGMDALPGGAPLPTDGGAKWKVRPGGGRL
ncbi:MAG TPA: hypothetical protein VMH39_08795, partial [Gemmatimonadaceae bacterium]|nr:hypothetical protein [Gemmatimonadaceae bacterium]